MNAFNSSDHKRLSVPLVIHAVASQIEIGRTPQSSFVIFQSPNAIWYAYAIETYLGPLYLILN